MTRSRYIADLVLVCGSVACAVVIVALAALWATSYEWTLTIDRIVIGRRYTAFDRSTGWAHGRRSQVVSHRGIIYLGKSPVLVDRGDVWPDIEARWEPSRVALVPQYPQTWLNRRGFVFDLGKNEAVIACPIWVLLVPLSILPIAAICRARSAIRIARGVREKRCPECGYDCRATPDQCPECGHVLRPSSVVDISQLETSRRARIRMLPKQRSRPTTRQ